jgi:putative hydrolase of the HAD superfamily
MTQLSPHSADALLFDLGRVVIDFDLQRAFAGWAADAGCPPADLAGRFKMDETYRQHERGEIPDAAFFSELRQSLGIDITDEQFLAGWNGIFISEMLGVDALLKRAAKQLPLYAFSNTNAAHILHLTHRFDAIFGNFRHVFASSAIGLRKPEAAAYDHVVAAIGVPAQRIVFFDDLIENVEGARSRGLQAVHVRTTADIVDSFAALAI